MITERGRRVVGPAEEFIRTLRAAFCRTTYADMVRSKDRGVRIMYANDCLGDTAEGLRRILEKSFETVEVDVVGSTANFRASAPRSPTTTS